MHTHMPSPMLMLHCGYLLLAARFSICRNNNNFVFGFEQIITRDDNENYCYCCCRRWGRAAAALNNTRKWLTINEKWWTNAHVAHGTGYNDIERRYYRWPQIDVYCLFGGWCTAVCVHRASWPARCVMHTIVSYFCLCPFTMHLCPYEFLFLHLIPMDIGHLRAFNRFTVRTGHFVLLFFRSFRRF